ncbi:MAG: DUF3772 domain-containing protein, partial [Hyphomicrobiaceae bacterium]
LNDRITVLRYRQFTRNLLQRQASPLLPGIWQDVQHNWAHVTGRIRYYGGDWLHWAGRVRGSVTALLAGAAGFFIVAALGVLAISRRFLASPSPAPGFFQRVARATWMVPLRALPLAGLVVILYIGFAELDLLFSPWQDLATTILGGVLIFAVSTAVLSVTLQPSHPAWRLLPVDNRTSRRIMWIAAGFIAIYVLDTALVSLGRVIYVPLSVSIAQSALSNVAFALFLLAFVWTRIIPMAGPDRPFERSAHETGTVKILTPVWIKLPALLAGLGILAATAWGYISLGRFIAHQIILSGTVLASAGLLYLALRAITRTHSDDPAAVGTVLEGRLGIADSQRRRQLSWLVEALGTLLIILVAVPLLLLQWGYSTADVRQWATALLFGFDVGQFHISFVRILAALALFTVLLFFTRLVQRWLRERVLNQPRMDQGIANSIETAVGYAGISLALLLALSWAGLDITSLAIVAGALSVGIGFGLQSIVNNFVSGLILLVERPIKVGDWVVIGAEQGNVRRISVRSTEIETFDKA